MHIRVSVARVDMIRMISRYYVTNLYPVVVEYSRSKFENLQYYQSSNLHQIHLRCYFGVKWMGGCEDDCA